LLATRYQLVPVQKFGNLKSQQAVSKMVQVA
jgi:hypothetical protein